MHLLFVTSIVPDGTGTSGYEIANAAIIDALRRAGVRVTVMGFIWPGKQPSDPDETIVLGAIDLRTEAASPSRKLAWLAQAVASGLTFSSAKLRVASESDIRAAIAGAGPVDGYVLNSVQFAAAYENLFRDRPALFVAHNVEYRSAEENAETAESVIQRTLFRREAKLLKGVEARLCDRARFVYTLAEEDRAALGVADDSRSAALPLVTRLKAVRPAPRSIEYDAALIGTWTWQPNRIGLDWFLREVTPHLDPRMSIHIAGHVPAGYASSHPGVRFVGRVPDADAFVRAAAVIPLISRAGTGVQLKTIETFELGLPSVATRSALRGLDYLPPNCRVADDAPAFAKALQAAVDSRMADVDGSDFHARQMAELDRRLALGISTIAGSAREAAA